MNNVITLIANPEASTPLGHVADSVKTCLESLGAAVSATEWLAPETACDIEFASLTVDDVNDANLAMQLEHPVDLIVQPKAKRRKRLLVADMESTIIQNEMLDELAREAGIFADIADITARAMRGELDFEAALRQRVQRLAGLDVSILAKTRDQITITSGAETLVRTMRANGAYCALVSGGFTYYTGHIKDLLGFDYHQANTLTISDGKLSGGVGEPILGRNAKREALIALCDRLGLTPADAITVGDGANDLAMLQAAGIGVAYHAKPIVAQAVNTRVSHGDLTALLFIQGYKQAEFVTT